MMICVKKDIRMFLESASYFLAQFWLKSKDFSFLDFSMSEYIRTRL